MDDPLGPAGGFSLGPELREPLGEHAVNVRELAMEIVVSAGSWALAESCRVDGAHLHAVSSPAVAGPKTPWSSIATPPIEAPPPAHVAEAEAGNRLLVRAVSRSYSRERPSRTRGSRTRPKKTPERTGRDHSYPRSAPPAEESGYEP